jgi:hypothetical protein
MKMAYPTEPPKWSTNAILKTQNILPLDRSTHEGTQKIALACKQVANSASFCRISLQLIVLYTRSGSCIKLLKLGDIAPGRWRQALSKWQGVLINTSACRPTSRPQGPGTGRAFFREGHAVALARSCVKVVSDALAGNTVYSMYELACKFCEFFDVEASIAVRRRNLELARLARDSAQVGESSVLTTSHDSAYWNKFPGVCAPSQEEHCVWIVTQRCARFDLGLNRRKLCPYYFTRFCVKLYTGTNSRDFFSIQ